MRIVTMVIIFTFLLISFVTFAEDEKANFSGEWSLNEEKSELGEGRRLRAASKLTITQEGNNLSIERLSTRRSGEEFKTEEKLTLDGKECKNIVFRDRERKSIANWSKDGKSLNISSSIVFERNGEEFEISSVEIWKLLEDGKTLSIEYTSKSSRGERKATYFYDKQRDK